MNSIILIRPPDRRKRLLCLAIAVIVVPVIDKRAFARAVIVVDAVSTCRRAQALQFCLAMMAWTPTWHPVHSRRERTRMASVDLGQSVAPLPSTTLQLSLRSFTMVMQQILSSISPAKRPTPTFALPPKKICFDVSNALALLHSRIAQKYVPSYFHPGEKVEWRRWTALGLAAS